MNYLQFYNKYKNLLFFSGGLYLGLLTLTEEKVYSIGIFLLAIAMGWLLIFIAQFITHKKWKKALGFLSVFIPVTTFIVVIVVRELSLR